jgi:hypothetical protein
MDSSHVNFVLPLLVFSLPGRLITPLRINDFRDLRWICPKHLK